MNPSQNQEQTKPTEADRILRLERELEIIQERNHRVERDKAWETSRTRRAALLVLTYLITLAVFMALGTTSPHRAALIPTAGYLLSTLTLPALRTLWERYRAS